MRLSPSYYPETVELYCVLCDRDHVSVAVDSIEDDFVRVLCPTCDEPTYVRVIE